MRWPLHAMSGLPVSASDGVAGSLRDVYFHDTLWLVRAVGVSAATRRLLIPAGWLQGCRLDAAGMRLAFSLKDATSLPGLADSSVRSGRSLRGYEVLTSEGSAGRVRDVLVDDAGWWIPGFIVDTQTLLPGSARMVPSSAVATIDSVQRRVHFQLTRKQLGTLWAPEPSALPL